MLDANQGWSFPTALEAARRCGQHDISWLEDPTVAEGLVENLIIDSTWAGGLTTWRKAAVMAEMYQIPLAAHHDPQIHVHALAASPTGFILESFADPTRDPLWFELFRERPAIVDGFMAVPETPGLGLELRAETLEKYGVKI